MCDEPRSLNPCKPFLIGGHTWGSEHLKLFYSQRNRIEAVLAHGTSQLNAAPVPVATTVYTPCPDHSRTQPYRENTPRAADAQADADAAACSLGSSSLSAIPPPPWLVPFTSTLPLFLVPATCTLQRPASYIVPYGGQTKVAHTLNLDSHRDCSPGLRHSLRRALHARQNTPPSLPASSLRALPGVHSSLHIRRLDSGSLF